jgi:hypothetical protein
MSKILDLIAVVLLLCIFGWSVYIHRNDGRFVPLGNRLVSVDTRTGAACLSGRPKDVFDQVADKELPYCVTPDFVPLDSSKP